MIVEMTARVAAFARRTYRGPHKPAAFWSTVNRRDRKGSPCQPITPRNCRPFRADRDDNAARFDQVDGYPEMFRSIVQPALPVLICTRDLRQMGDVIGWFRAQGISLNLADNLDSVQAALADAPLHWSFVFVDIDSFGGIADCNDDLIAFRRNAPSLPVVLVSLDFLVDDFTCERLSLADVSLQAPVPYSALELSLLIAQQNNTSWQLRLKA